MEAIKNIVVPGLIELTKSEKLQWRTLPFQLGFSVTVGGWTLRFQEAVGAESDFLEFSHSDYEEEEYDGTDYASAPWLCWGDSKVLPPLGKAILEQLAARKPAPIVIKTKTINPVPPIDDLVQSVNRLLGK